MFPFRQFSFRTLGNKKILTALMVGSLKVLLHSEILRNIIFTFPSKVTVHCKPLQGNYRVELVHREIPVVITGNEFTEYSFLLFWLHFFPCFNNIEIVALVPVICTGNCQFILQGFKGCFNTL